MNLLIFGATGMVGQSLVRECLLDADISHIKIIGRISSGIIHPKLNEFIHDNMWLYDGIEAELMPFDACCFCVGVSSAGMTETEYKRITYEMTLAAAKTLVQLNPQMTFMYISGAGTDSTECGSSMWARVKGKTENALLALPFKAAYMLRPAGIQPMHGVQSKTISYRILYSLTKPLLPLLRWLFPNQIISSETLSRVMIHIVKKGASKPILESTDLHKISLTLN